MVKYCDVVFGASYGDEGKGKVSSYLSPDYDVVARWAGGNNAGHTVYVDDKQYKTHLVPSGVFYGVKSVIGPGCVLHPESFQKELKYLSENGFDPSLVKVSPNCHIVTDQHIEFDKQNLSKELGTTSKGIAPAYASKFARTGLLAKDILKPDLLWDGDLDNMRVLAEGAQGMWLDIDYGTYPYVTSSITLPYGAASLGFSPKKIRKIYGVCKAYETRSGEDPLFPSSLLDDPQLKIIGELGKEYGVTTGRRRKVDWLNLDRLIKAVNISGTTDLIINKGDILKDYMIKDGIDLSNLNKVSLYFNNVKVSFGHYGHFESFIESTLRSSCKDLETIKFSYSPSKI